MELHYSKKSINIYGKCECFQASRELYDCYVHNVFPLTPVQLTMVRPIGRLWGLCALNCNYCELQL